ncbi:MAG: DNA polymerase III subunit delta' [Propionibacteriaceae bacterium]|jgi:DNA polymerase-3 subunit delta'|nr:DNA polymerase III subunit delta' [Propionibacteriaceae bacterium]
MTVWDDLVGQDAVVATLQQAVAGGAHAMTHAWLVTGPPGSGRSNAARAFAAALQCERGGCGECNACRTALDGTHPDVTVLRTEQLSIGVDEVRELVRRAAMAPTMGRWQVLIVEDADRVTERGADALLKAIEEPASRTVWLLCAPTADDVVVTIRSRSRLLTLLTPSDEAVAQLLMRRDGIEEEQARFVARIAQGHIGRARGLARHPEQLERRREILTVPSRLNGLGDCLATAERLVSTTQEDVKARTSEIDAREKAALTEALGLGAKGSRRGGGGSLKDLEERQQLRAKRMQRDALDFILTEWSAFYRDVMTIQTDAQVPLINADLADAVRHVADTSTPEVTVKRIDAIIGCREALATNVTPLLAMESLLTSLL